MIYARILIICSLGFFSQKKTTWAIKKIVLKLVFTATRNDGMENNLSQGLLLGQVCFQINYFSLLHVLSFASLIFFSTNLWSPAFSRFSRRFPINLSVGCTGDNKTWFTETGRCSHLWRETQTDRLRFACKVLQLLLIFFFDFWGKKKKGHILLRVCVCVVLSAVCGFMAVGEKMLSRLGILFRVAAVLVKIGGHVLYDNIGFACLVIFFPFFLPIFIARESLSFF